MANKIDKPSGWYFQEHKDANSHQCSYYYKKVVSKAAITPHRPFHHPIMIVMTEQYFRIYWRGNVQATIKDWDDYEVHPIFSTEFGAMHQEHFLDWINHAKLLPKAYSNNDSSLYEVKVTSFDHALAYGNTYHANIGYIKVHEDVCNIVQKCINKTTTSLRSLFNKKKTEAKPQTEVKRPLETLGFEEFFLDLLFDLKHSNVFRQHPAYSKLITFLESIPKVRAIWLKAEFQLTHSLCRDLYIKGEQSKQGEIAVHFPQLAHAQEEYAATAEKWLTFIRSTEGERILKPNKDEKWFSGSEAEHNAVFKACNADFLNKQAEESVQWLIGRYAMVRAYALQFGRLYHCYSKLVIWGSVLLLVLLYFTGCPWLLWFPNFNSLNEYSDLFKTFTAASFIGVSFIISIIAERIPYFVYSFFHFLPQKITKKRPSRTWDEILSSIPKIVETLKPKIFLASAAVWAVLFSTDLAWNLDFYFSRYYLYVIGVLWFFTWLFLASHLAHFVNKKQKFWRVLLRSLTLYLISVFYAFIIGFVGMCHSSKSHFSKGEELREYFSQFDNRGGDFMSNKQGSYLYCGQDASNQNICEIIEGNSEIAKKIKRDWYYENTLKHLYRDTISPNKKVCYVFSLEVDKKLMPSRTYVIVIDTLLFFTFITAALGLMLEMGLRPKTTSY